MSAAGRPTGGATAGAPPSGVDVASRGFEAARAGSGLGGSGDRHAHAVASRLRSEPTS